MKITKSQLKQIIKEELESVIMEEEPDANADPFDDELLNPDDDKGIPSISSVLTEIDLGTAYLIGEAASAILVLSYAAMKIVIGPAVSGYLAKREAEIMRGLNEEEKAEAINNIESKIINGILKINLGSLKSKLQKILVSKAKIKEEIKSFLKTKTSL